MWRRALIRSQSTDRGDRTQNFIKYTETTASNPKMAQVELAFPNMSNDLLLREVSRGTDYAIHISAIVEAELVNLISDPCQ